MDIHDFADYKDYVRARLAAMPQQGRGQFQEIARVLRMHATRVSHVFKGDDHLTLEQGLGLARHLGLRPFEVDYFLNQLQLARAGTPDLRRHYQAKLDELKEKSLELSTRVPATRILQEEQQGIFYSNWFYSGIRLLSSLPGNHTVDSIAARFDIPRELANAAMQFLLETGLCVRADGQLRMGPKSTHLPASSPLIGRLHGNWRLKAMAHHHDLGSEGIAYTSPMSIRKADAKKIRRLLVDTIERATELSDSDEQDSLYCLNLDWFEF